MVCIHKHEHHQFTPLPRSCGNLKVTLYYAVLDIVALTKSEIIKPTYLCHFPVFPIKLPHLSKLKIFSKTQNDKTVIKIINF